MSTYSFSSLKDLLKDLPPTPKLTFDDSPSYSTKKTSGNEPNTPFEDPYVTEMFGELYFKESPNGVSMSELFPPIELPPSFLSKTEKSGNKARKEKRLGKLPITEDACVYPNIWESEGKLFPPPISCLKLLKVGKPFIFDKFDNNFGRFVQEVIYVLPQGVMCTVRGNGRLVMKFANDFLVDVKDEKEEGSDEE